MADHAIQLSKSALRKGRRDRHTFMRMLSGKHIRKGSRGADKWVEWVYHENVADCLKAKQADGVQVVAMEICNISCAVIDDENSIVSRDALDLADHAIHLPHAGHDEFSERGRGHQHDSI